MGALSEMRELMASAEGQKAFLAWYGDDFTQRMLAAARELARPNLPHSADAVQISLYLGSSVGANSIVDFLSNPQVALPSATKLVPDYGARRAVQQETK